jgi:hypothetical protein
MSESPSIALSAFIREAIKEVSLAIITTRIEFKKHKDLDKVVVHPTLIDERGHRVFEPITLRFDIAVVARKTSEVSAESKIGAGGELSSSLDVAGLTIGVKSTVNADEVRGKISAAERESNNRISFEIGVQIPQALSKGVELRKPTK